jgi:hypothetical protein
MPPGPCWRASGAHEGMRPLHAMTLLAHRQGQRGRPALPVEWNQPGVDELDQRLPNPQQPYCPVFAATMVARS